MQRNGMNICGTDFKIQTVSTSVGDTATFFSFNSHICLGFIVGKPIAKFGSAFILIVFVRLLRQNQIPPGNILRMGFYLLINEFCCNSHDHQAGGNFGMQFIK